jgi:hypothetical protein
VYFEIIGELSVVETIATGSGIRELAPAKALRSRAIKLYVALADAKAAKHGQLRVIDESGEDYLYPQEFFVAVELPQPLRRCVLQAA